MSDGTRICVGDLRLWPATGSMFVVTSIAVPFSHSVGIFYMKVQLGSKPGFSYDDAWHINDYSVLLSAGYD